MWMSERRLATTTVGHGRPHSTHCVRWRKTVHFEFHPLPTFRCFALTTALLWMAAEPANARDDAMTAIATPAPSHAQGKPALPRQVHRRSCSACRRRPAVSVCRPRRGPARRDVQHARVAGLFDRRHEDLDRSWPDHEGDRLQMGESRRLGVAGDREGRQVLVLCRGRARRYASGQGHRGRRVRTVRPVHSSMRKALR